MEIIYGSPPKCGGAFSTKYCVGSTFYYNHYFKEHLVYICIKCGYQLVTNTKDHKEKTNAKHNGISKK